MKIYTTGYTGTHAAKGTDKRAAMLAFLEKHNAVLVDIRINPWSRNPDWCKAELERFFWGRYWWVQNLGNCNHRGQLGEGFHIKNMEVGCAQLGEITCRTGAKALVLFCACCSDECCHRSFVRDELSRLSEYYALGYELEEMGAMWDTA